MKFIGIVGAEGAKFTKTGENEARILIRAILTGGAEGYPEIDPVTLVSGHCHLGGIDIWAEEVADDLKIPKVIFPPKVLSWESQGTNDGFKARNIKIAMQSDIVHNITVKRLPVGFKGMKHNKCYHCDSDSHIKSGGCWTMLRAAKYGNRGILHELANTE